MNNFEERLEIIGDSLEEVRALLRANGNVEGIALELQTDLRHYAETADNKDAVIADLRQNTINIVASIDDMLALENATDGMVCVIITKDENGTYHDYMGTYVYSTGKAEWIKAKAGMNLSPKVVQSGVTYLSDNGEEVGVIGDSINELEIGQKIFNAVFKPLTTKVVMPEEFTGTDVLGAICVNDIISPIFYTIDWSIYDELDISRIPYPATALNSDMLLKFNSDCHIIVGTQAEKDYLLEQRQDLTNITVIEGGE